MNINQSLPTITRQILWSLFVLVSAFVFVGMQPVKVLAADCPDGMSQFDCAAINGNWQNWIPDEADSSSCSTPDSGATAQIDRVLQTLAFRESGGNPTATNSVSSASGKYQYLDGTWKARRSLYSEVKKYPRAKDAPEAVQDAVAFLEYSEKINTYNGDLFKIALSHFYPAAISNPSLLDSQIGGNSVTPRQYADGFVKQYNDNVGAKIKLYYKDAPNLPSVVASSTGTSSSTGGCGGGTNSGDLGVGSGKFTDNGEVKDFANVLANSKASDSAFGNGFVGCGVCAAVVSRVWQGRDIGYGLHAGTDGAIGMWWQYKNTIGHADRSPKKGAILLYTSSNPAGHVVIYLGNNKVLNDGQIWNAGDLESKWHLGYQGWVDPNQVGWTSVKATNIRTALASKLGSICN